MAARTTLSPADCDLLFTPALGAFVISGGLGSRLLSYDVAQTIIDVSAGNYLSTSDKLSEIEKKKLRDSIQINAVISLGTACFGFVFERYKRMVDSQPGQIGQAFGLTPTRVMFEREFPNATVTTWQGRSSSDYWFSSMIRNAFAHAQWNIIDGFDPNIEKNGDQRIQLWNINGNQTTFDITLTISELRDIIVASLFHFITYIQQTSTVWPPKRTILSHEILHSLLQAELVIGKLKDFFEEDGRRMFLGVDLMAHQNAEADV